jgi:hypothetical protein
LFELLSNEQYVTLANIFEKHSGVGSKYRIALGGSKIRQRVF